MTWETEGSTVGCRAGSGSIPQAAPRETPRSMSDEGVRRLLAVDAGLRAGFAVYRDDGRLESYRSTNFGAPKRLRSAVHRILREIDDLARVVVEGRGNLADPWIKEAERRGIPTLQVDAGTWRKALLLPRQRRTGATAKEEADELARRIIDWSGAPRPTSLRHDAAEAILVGFWGAMDAGWATELP